MQNLVNVMPEPVRNVGTLKSAAVAFTVKFYLLGQTGLYKQCGPRSDCSL